MEKARFLSKSTNQISIRESEWQCYAVFLPLQN
jgi:hypothetical protein